MVLAGFKPVAGLREAAWVGSIPTRLRQHLRSSNHPFNSLAILDHFADLALTKESGAPGKTDDSMSIHDRL